MKKSIGVLIIILLLVSCQKQADFINTDRSTLHMDQADEELTHIAIHARDTLPEFFRHLLRPSKDEGNFMVKYPFRADRESGFNMEHLWLSDLRYKNGVYYGVITNTPFYISSVKKGDLVTFNMEEISDWMYTSNEKIIGGYSIIYLLEQLNEHSEGQQIIMEMFSK